VILAQVVESTPAIEPTVLVLLSIFGGAALTALAGWYGAWRASIRGHERWLRERRLEAYVGLIALLHKMQTDREAQDGARKKIAEIREESDSNPLMAQAVEPLLASLESEVRDINARTALYENHVFDVTAPFAILGPQKAATTVTELMSAMSQSDGEAFDAAEERLLKEMREALDIKD